MHEIVKNRKVAVAQGQKDDSPFPESYLAFSRLVVYYTDMIDRPFWKEISAALDRSLGRSTPVV